MRSTKMIRIKKAMNLQKNNFGKLNSRKKPVANFIKLDKFDMKDQPRSQSINCDKKPKRLCKGFQLPNFSMIKIPAHLPVPLKRIRKTTQTFIER